MKRSPAYLRGLHDGAIAQRRHIRSRLLAVGVIPEGYWAVRAVVIKAIKAATVAPRRRR